MNSDVFKIEDLIKRYFQEEHIENYKCSFCNTNSTIRKLQRLIHCPTIMLAYIKRFNMFGTVPQKLDTKIKAKKHLHIDMIYGSEKGDYILNSYVSHKGQISSGHYVATLRKNDNWILISDEKGGIDSIEDLSNKGSPEVYLMAYTKPDSM